MAKYYVETTDYDGYTNLDFTPYDTPEAAQGASEDISDRVRIVESSGDVLRYIKERNTRWRDGDYRFEWDEYAEPTPPKDLTDAYYDALLSNVLQRTRYARYAKFVTGKGIIT